MVYDIELVEDAELELDLAVQYYEGINTDLMVRFFHNYIKTRERVESNPFQFPIHRAGMRKAIVPGFPYTLVFTIEVTRVAILAIIHHKSGEKKLLKRLRERF